MKRNNDGKSSETKVQEALTTLQAKNKFFFMRLYDTGSARGSIIPAQIADYFFVFRGTPVSLEVKSSSVHSSMKEVPRSYVRDSQIAKLRLLLRAGGRGMFIFESLKNCWEIWEGEAVVRWHRKETKKLPEPLATFSKAKEMPMELTRVLNLHYLGARSDY